DMLHEALFVPDGEPRPPRSLLDQPELRRYVEEFGLRPGDLGVIGEVEGRAVGACWIRRFPEHSPGYGWVGDDVPELSIAGEPRVRGHGLGSELIGAVCTRAGERGDARISLSVDGRSPARRLYERFGFVTEQAADGTLTMVRGL